MVVRHRRLDPLVRRTSSRQALAVVAALCATVGRTVADAASRLHDVDPELPGFVAFDQG
jgi:hypothetical protein